LSAVSAINKKRLAALTAVATHYTESVRAVLTAMSVPWSIT